MEPNITDQVVAALYAPTGGIVCPFGLTIALAENACDNGVEFKFLTEVTDIKKIDGGYELAVKGKEAITTRFVVNAAGVYADVFHNMVCDDKIEIIPRKGDYCLLDQEAGKHVDKTIFQLPGKYGKGILVAPPFTATFSSGLQPRISMIKRGRTPQPRSWRTPRENPPSA